MKLLPTCFLAGRLCSIGAGSIALVLSPLPLSPLLSSTDSKIGSNSSMSSARSHERSVCQAGVEGGYDLPAAEKSRPHSADMGSVNCCTLAPWHSPGSPPLNLGLTCGCLQGALA